MAINLDDIKLTQMPDGMPHLKIGDGSLVIDGRIRTSDDLIKLGLVVDVLNRRGYKNIELNLLYLSAQRMDRPIDDSSPFTLKVFADYINSLNFSRVVLHCPHSDVMPALINNSVIERHFLDTFVEDSISSFIDTYKITPDELSIVFPDSHASKHFPRLNMSGINIVECAKKRDMATGKLSGFKIVDGEVRPFCILLDDLCDGGGTFEGIRKLLIAAGCQTVALATYHGIYSKGLDVLAGFARVYTTNSYKNWYDSWIDCFCVDSTAKGQR